MIRVLWGLIVLWTLAGCATHFENAPLAQGEANVERRVIDVSDKTRPVILIAISGGGSRAAALGWNVLRELRGVNYSSQGKERRLIDDVAIVSSVSGGSVVAAYFGLNGPEGLDRFEEFLAQDNIKSLLLTAANPFAWIGNALSGRSRTDFVVDLFNEQLFNHRTLAELNKPGKPFVILNATDMVAGDVFSIIPSRFDDICSSFDKLPIAIAVTASANFPIVLAPIAFRNFSATECIGRPMPEWITNKLQAKFGPYINIEEYKRARYANDLRFGKYPFRVIEYLYFLDGGLADNLGIHSLLDTIVSPRGPGGVLARINNGDIKNLVVIVVNARSDPVRSEYTSPHRPGILGMLNSVTSVPIDSTTASVDAQLNVLLAELKQAGNSAPSDAKFGGLRVYGIQIDFDQLRIADPAQKAMRDRAKAIPTSWTISAEDRIVLKDAAQLLMHQHPCFQRLLLDLKVEAAYVDPAFAMEGCPH